MSHLLRVNRDRVLFAATKFYVYPHAGLPPSAHPSERHSLCGSHRRQFSLNGMFTSLSNSAAVGHFQDGLVRLHDTTGLPWWATIILSTVMLRTIITLPLTVYQYRITARLEQITAEMPAIIQELKQETVVAKHQFKLSDAQARVIYNRSVKKQWDKLVVRENCHPLKSFCVVWGQIPLWIVQSMALRNLLGMLPDPGVVQAQLTFTELTLGGCAWFPNLTEVDSSLILPVTLGALNLAIIEIQVMTRTKDRSKLQIYATNFFRAFSLGMIPIAAGVPSALCLYWTASSCFGLGQNLLLLAPTVRRITGIPKTSSELSEPFGHLSRVTAERWAALQTKLGVKTNRNEH